MDKSLESINLKDRFRFFNELWSPKVIGELNDYQVKIVKVKGEFVWHKHIDTDELFFVVDGCLKIELEEGIVKINKGELYIVPKGKLHKPFAEVESQLLIIEPRGVINTGENHCDLTAENNIWSIDETK